MTLAYPDTGLTWPWPPPTLASADPGLQLTLASPDPGLSWLWPHLTLASPENFFTWQWPHLTLASSDTGLKWPCPHMPCPHMTLASHDHDLTWPWLHLTLASPDLGLTGPCSIWGGQSVRPGMVLTYSRPRKTFLCALHTAGRNWQGMVKQTSQTQPTMKCLCGPLSKHVW